MFGPVSPHARVLRLIRLLFTFDLHSSGRGRSADAGLNNLKKAFNSLIRRFVGDDGLQNAARFLLLINIQAIQVELTAAGITSRICNQRAGVSIWTQAARDEDGNPLFVSSLAIKAHEC